MNKQNKKIIILGSTGSVGRQTVDVARAYSVTVEGIAAYQNIHCLEEQIRLMHPRFCAVLHEEAAKDLSVRTADTDTKIVSGQEGLLQMIEASGADMAFNSIMGRAGLEPTLAAIHRGMDIALANKETLVCAGELVMQAAKENRVKILPVDSEHSAIFQCLLAGKREEVKRLILTASGGPFFGRTKDELRGISKEQALKHPTWSMGQKISIDSATMMNKGFEIIEACHLFGLSADKVDVIVHRESIIHSMVEFTDGCVMAQMGLPDMRSCIRYALFYPDRCVYQGESLDLTTLGKLTFYSPDEDTFSLLPLARRAFQTGGLLPCVLNAANEAAVDLFLHDQIEFMDIFDIVTKVVQTYPNSENPTLFEIMQADKEVRSAVKEGMLK
ncbi:MAG: 1-deoxy-D-xylulose-5-phosphate reductoisomerase [Clostridiales bacterium]|nr:1-deoxy-D-xylulose-5-phosphate reductoisomerase [Clostridiales bacterium]